ncbi:MAG: serine hydrolase [Sedimentisphaerales bacterium]|nr:serine hydrolase [Sedimentisphaerales bacterium]
MDVGKLEELAGFAGGRGCVVRHGYMVYTWGDITARRDIASAAKPFYSYFLLKAWEDKRIPGLDQKVMEWEPRLRELNADLGFKDRDITWRHLANQVSCYGVREKPGTAYDYNDWQMALFFDILFLKVYGASFETVDKAVLHPILTDILQCQDNPTFMGFGTEDRPGRTAISCRDFARFGLLYLRQGQWKEKKLLSPQTVKMVVSNPLPNSIPRSAGFEKGQEAEMISDQRSIGSRRIPDNQTDHMGSYSWLWWINGVDREGKRHWPDVPTDTFGAFGHGGMRAMVVLPGLDVIVCWNDTQIEGRDKENHTLKLLVESIIEKH